MKICLIALHAYSLFNLSTNYVFGGSEVRAWLFAKGLAELPGTKVSFIVLNTGQRQIEDYGKVTVLRHSYYGSPQEEKPGGLAARFLGGRISGHFANRKLKEEVYHLAAADIYCGFGVSEVTAEISDFCRRNKKKFVLMGGSDYDFSAECRKEALFADYYGSSSRRSNRVIEQADAVITQTHFQASLVWERFGKSAVVVRNPVDLSNPTSDGGDRKIALWIGKSDDVKQPQILLDLARRFPGISFVMLMNLSRPEIHEHVKQLKPDDVVLIEYLPFFEAERLFARAFVLINTSRFEGFPNAFLQAGKYGVPVISLIVDPDRFIEENRCGIIAGGDTEALARGLSLIQSDKDMAQSFSKNISNYVASHHELREQVQKLYQVLRAVAG